MMPVCLQTPPSITRRWLVDCYLTGKEASLECSTCSYLLMCITVNSSMELSLMQLSLGTTGNSQRSCVSRFTMADEAIPRECTRYCWPKEFQLPAEQSVNGDCKCIWSAEGTMEVSSEATCGNGGVEEAEGKNCGVDDVAGGNSGVREKDGRWEWE